MVVVGRRAPRRRRPGGNPVLTRSRWLWLALAIAGVATAAALAARSGGKKPTTGKATARGSGELVVALQSDGKTLDPHVASDAASMRLIENMYSTLMRYTRRYGDVEPDLAERYEISPDHLRYTFHLRRGVHFHESGRELEAADVKFSIERIRKKQIRADQFSPVARIETPDRYTVVFDLSRPFAPLLVYLAHPMNAIVDRRLLQAKGDAVFRKHDAGSGPFRMVEWKKGDHLTLERDPHYYIRGLPRVERLVYRPIADENARTTALRTGEVDIELDVPPRDIAELRADPAIDVDSVPGTFWEYIGLNTQRAPFNDRRVRQAIAWAVDRPTIDRLVKLGRATVLDGGNIPPSHWAYAGLHMYTHRDVARAKQLLDQAGYGQGFSATLKVGSAFPYQVNAAQVIKQELRDVGIRIHIAMQESGLFFDSLGRHDFDMDVVGWVGFVDPDEWTYNLFHTGGKYNQQGYSNPLVDALLDRGRRIDERAHRKRIYRQIQRIVATDAPMVFLYDNNQISAARRRVKGFFVHPTASTIFLRDVSLGDAR